MGLDQYAHKVDEHGATTQIACWRKHNRLHAWMERTHRERSGMDYQNLTEMEVTEEDIDSLEIAVQSARLPKTVGYFFGVDSYENPDKSACLRKQDLEFISVARVALQAGYKVTYHAWW